MKKLFEPVSIGSLSIRNRFLKAATYEGRATPEGELTPELMQLYLQWARGGAGAIITGYAYVMQNEQPNPRMLGIYDDRFISHYQGFTDAIHAAGSRVILQIVYGGSQNGKIMWKNSEGKTIKDLIEGK